jgi:hypothetical protein
MHFLYFINWSSEEQAAAKKKVCHFLVENWKSGSESYYAFLDDGVGL